MNLSKPLNILIDMDVIVFRAALVGEVKTEWQPAYVDEYGVAIAAVTSTDLDIKKSQSYMDWTVKSIVSKVLKYKEWQVKYNIIPCLSDKVNFRKTIYPEYKMNRADKPKPQLYQEVRKYAEDNYECRCLPGLEADDQIAILATSLELCIIASIDKDFLTIPNTCMFNIDKGTFTDTTEESATRFHLYQCLIGDTVDNIKGCVGIGKVKATKILDEECSWGAVVRTYISKGQTKEDALLNARLVRILHASDWDAEKQEVILWNPEQL